MNPNPSVTRATLLAAVLLASLPVGASAQAFTQITSGNPIVTDPVPASAAFTGCAWIDYDGDGDQDLYIVQQGLYRNDGGGSFTHVPTCPAGHDASIGVTWADFDNDGDPDFYVSGGEPAGSIMVRNDGGDAFTTVTTGAAGDSVGNQGWGCAWGDYDRDGWVDLVVAAAFGFGSTTPNHLLHNDGAGLFTSVDTSIVCAATGPYTIPTWNDVDGDGDPDLFIASGPANGTRAPDFLYLNHCDAPGSAFFTRITTGDLATDNHDAQIYNWADIDEDGDLDVYVTNYAGMGANDLYRNDDGVFTRLTNAQAGTIVTDAGHSLASVWADLDNDGDLDCLVTKDGPTNSIYYVNNGAGFFTRSFSILRQPGPTYGAAAGDYDGDGDLDVYIHGDNSTRGLFRNQSSAVNGWLEVRCLGTRSNRSALGARVQVVATINGVRRRLVQQVSAQNSFGGHDPLELHFGVGDAVAIDSLRVEFPSGMKQIYLGVVPRQRLTVVENTATSVESPSVAGDGIRWLGSNPARGTLRLAITLPRAARVDVELIDASGRVALARRFTSLGAGTQRVELGDSGALAPGLYWVRARSGAWVRSTRVVVLR